MPITDSNYDWQYVSATARIAEWYVEAEVNIFQYSYDENIGKCA